jgi:hypothetical protein
MIVFFGLLHIVYNDDGCQTDNNSVSITERLCNRIRSLKSQVTISKLMQTSEREKYFTDTQKNIPLIRLLYFFCLYICRKFV